MISPDADARVEKDWYQKLFPRAAYVYENHAQLWMTARELFADEGFSVPEDVRRLVESVYSDAGGDVPASLQRSAQTAEGRDSAKRSVGAQNVLKFADGYRRDAGLWGSDTVTPTRIGDKRRRLRLARVVDGRVVPWSDDPDTRRAWALSEVAVRANRIERRATLPPPLEVQACAIEAGWKDYDADVVLTVLRGDQPVRVVLSKGERDVDLSYDRSNGLVFGV